MKDNTLEHLFDFVPQLRTVKLTENKFLKQRNQNNEDLAFVSMLEPGSKIPSIFNSIST